jgi:hypothetical protein
MKISTNIVLFLICGLLGSTMLAVWNYKIYIPQKDMAKRYKSTNEIVITNIINSDNVYTNTTFVLGFQINNITYYTNNITLSCVTSDKICLDNVHIKIISMLQLIYYDSNEPLNSWSYKEKHIEYDYYILIMSIVLIVLSPCCIIIIISYQYCNKKKEIEPVPDEITYTYDSYQPYSYYNPDFENNNIDSKSYEKELYVNNGNEFV